MRPVWLLALCAGCSFRGAVPAIGDGGPDDDAASIDAADASIDAVMMGVDFLPESEERFVSMNWSVGSGPTTIDTTTMVILPAAPAGVTFLVGVQDNGQPVAILRVGDFTIGADRLVTVTGERPLAILSDHDVTITGTLDVGARGARPGPGGAPPAMGTGAGGLGVHDDGSGSTYDDAGGGGASFTTAGAAGGKAGPFAGGAAGATYVLDGLIGGSGGGRASTCVNQPGAGGGALLLYGAHKIRINGVITAGGGGGGGGLIGCVTGAGAGAGGGSGGTIWIQTIDLGGTGVVAANGGGGGGASYVGIANGGPGQDGQPSTTQVASGGDKANSTEASAGGAGAIEGTPAAVVPELAVGNAGGGGGGLGLVVYRAPTLGTIATSPTATQP